MPDVVDDTHFELALHLCDRQLFVEALFLGSNEDLGEFDAQEASRQTFEPA